MTERTFRLTSLGCAKNLVDSESLAGLLVRAGWRMVADGPADLVVVNTCAFIEDAAQESVDTLLAEIDEKMGGRTRWLAAIGCLPQKYHEGLAAALPGLDAVLGTADMTRLVEWVDKLTTEGGPAVAVSEPEREYWESPARLISTPPHRAYLKIAEGCDNACAFCLIGRLRGPFRSRSENAVLDEAASLAEAGVVELSLVAQDLTLYGRDLDPPTSLAGLIDRLTRRLAGTPLRWVRPLYLHPARVDAELVAALAGSDVIVPYVDTPLQHVNDRVLRRMGRPQDAASTRAVVQLLRREFPGVALRTTFLVGHPGEDEASFEQLLRFVEEMRFDHVGAFAWSPEEDTPSFSQDEQVPAEVRVQRLGRLLDLQRGISADLVARYVRTEVEVMIEEVLHKHDRRAYSHVGRLARQAPEVDGVVYVRAAAEADCRPGQFVRVRITRSSEYDLFGDLVG